MKSTKLSHIKKILSVVLCLALMMSCVPVISVPVSAADDITVTIDTGASVTLKDYDGDNYYEISTSDELFAFAAAVNGGSSTINAELTADVAVYENLIVDDSYNSNIGSVSGARKPEVTAEYNGTFDGQNYTISGLFLYNIRKSLALFHNIGSNGTVKNLRVADSYLYNLSSVGIALKNYGTITNCYINDDVVIGSINGALSSGMAYSNYGVISNCNSAARIVKASAKSAVTGIVGNNYGYVINCCNTGTFNSGDAKWAYFGGIAYYNYNVIANCYIFYDGLINVSDFGGIVYRNEEGGIITNSYTFGMNSPVADFYNSVARKNEGTVDSLSGEKSLSQFASGEVSYLLQQGATVEVDGTSTFYDGNIWGQDIDNGKTVQSYPTFTGDDVNYGYTCATGVDEKIYTNNKVSQNEKPQHTIENGKCIYCGYECDHNYVNGICEVNACYAPATLNAEGFYEIKNAGNLFWFAQQVNEVGNREIKGVLTDDINLEERPWTPIGTTGENNNNFRGVFNGQGHTITGLNVTGTKNGIGFFGEVRTGTVENFTIYGEVTVPGKYTYAGGVIGSTCGLNSENDLERNGATIRNIKSFVNLTLNAHGVGRVGGFVGYANHETLIENCEWYGTFDLGDYRAEAGVAGFLGRVQENSAVTIRNCGAYGTVKTNYKKGDYNGSKDIFVCGFIGWSVNGSNSADFTDTVIENCLFAGKVELGESITDQIDYSAFGCLSEIKSITNCYYLGENGLPGVNNNSTYKPSVTEVISVDESQLASGEVAYLLQKGNTEQVWGQQSNTEGSLPMLTDNELYNVVRVGQTGSYSVANVGDTSNNGFVEIDDYQLLVNMAVSGKHSQTETANYDDIIRYDLVSDGYIDVLDVHLMALVISGKAKVDIYAVGDIDQNGKEYEEADIKAIKHAIENPEKLATYKKYASDINGDGKIDENDLTALTAKYHEVISTACEENTQVYYTWGNSYSTCIATAICTLCNKKVATETVNTTSETLSELTCTQDGKVKYTATFSHKLFITKTTEAVTKTGGHNWAEWKTEIPASASSVGKEKRICLACGENEEREIEKLSLDDRIAAYYTVVGDKVINLVNGEEMENAIVDNDGYFRGGKVKLPSSYEKASVEAVMVYNRLSTDLPVGNGLSYYGGTFLFQEAVNPSNLGLIKTPFGGGQIGTNFTLRPSLNYNKRVMSEGESYWCLAFNKNESAYAMQINDDYVEKEHWSNYISSVFNLSAEHQFKQFIVYSEKLTKEEMADHFVDNKLSLSADTNTIVGRVNNGITGLGSAFAFTKTGQYGVPEWYDTSTKAGDYSINDGNGMMLNYTISDYVEPDLGIDHSKYESVHIIKKPEILPMGYKYALSAVPYPFNVNHNGYSDQYDVSWKSSDETVALVIDGMIIPQKAGTVTITATLRGTEISDSCTIQIVNKTATTDNAVKISANYISKNGNSFSQDDYVMTTNAIYDAISEAYEDGFNHIIFPEIDFYAVPTETEFYIPSGMTVEFPEGSAFHMMPSELAKTKGYTYFRMGWGWWSCAIPTEKASVEKDEYGNILAYYCRDAHLIIDKYYGEFYEKDATMNQLYSGANQYQWGCNLLSIGKRAEFCSVEVREANCPTGFFITMGGKGNSELVNGAQGSIAANEFVSGWLDDSGDLVENSDWISTNNFYLVSKAANGMDTLHEYYIGNWEHNLVVATQRLYDILWYDKDYNLIGANRWQYIDEGYSNKPDNAVYFKLSIQQSDLPTGTDEYVRICPDESSRFCEIKNTNIINSAVGLASVIGATEACWIHDNYVSGDGLMYGASRSLDLEDGWAGMRGTIIERNIFRKYAYSGSSDYRGPDSGVLVLASGYNTFVISNYIGAIQQSNYNVANTHIINNVVHTMYGSFSSGKPNDIRPKINSHIYYNVLGQKSNEISSNGVNYYHQNTIIPTVNLW